METRETEIRTRLEEAGVDVYALARTSETPAIWRVELAGSQGVAAWKALWAAHERTGLYPVLTGSASEPRDLVGLGGDGPDSLEKLLGDLPPELRSKTRRFSWMVWLLMTPFRLLLSLFRVHTLVTRELEYGLLLLLPRREQAHAGEPPRDGAGPGEPRLDEVRCLHDLNGQPHPRVVLLVVETREAWAVPTLLQFGGFNDCPPPKEHAETFRRWQKKFGAHIVAVTDDTVEAWVRSPPRRWPEARSLARDQWLYCPEDHRPYEDIAEGLLGAGQWFFWWD